MDPFKRLPIETLMANLSLSICPKEVETSQGALVRTSDPFKRLPTETLLTIVKFVPNLPSLCHFVQASNAVANIFKDCPSEIVEAVIGQLPQQLRSEIRTVARAFPNSPATTDIDSAADDLFAIFGNSLKLDDRDRGPLPRDFPLASIQTVVHMAHRIHRLAASFLRTHIDRINETKPTRPADLESNFFDHSLLENPEGRHYTPQHTGSSSWVEEYRVVRALWRIQLYYIQPSSSAESLKRIWADSQTTSSIWGELKPWEISEMESVHDYLEDTKVSLREQPPSNPVDVDAASSILTDPPAKGDDIALAWYQAL